MRTKTNVRDFVPGDVVKFKGVERILLNRVVMESGTEVFHVFHPDRGVFSAYEEELEYVGHLNEWENLITALNTRKFLKSA